MTEIITIDTREKLDKITHITSYFNSIEQRYIRSKLYTGDYTLTNNQRIVIDRKQNLLELAGNLGKQHDRFKAEILRAAEINARFIVLIEENISLADVPSWSNKRSQFKGETLAKVMATLTTKYGVEWQFCRKALAGQRIIEILKGGFNQ